MNEQRDMTGSGRDRPTPPTTDELRIAIDRGGQGDKVDFPDPAAAPLGTDAEAAGKPPTTEEVSLEPVGDRAPRHGFWAGPAVYVLIAAFVFGVFLTIVLRAS